jgi:DNA-binding response OmpR family regulator
METKGKILIIDDSATNVFLLQTLLEEQGFSVIFSYNGKEAMKYIEEQNFDLLLLDIMMPGVDGYDVLEKMSNEQKNTPVIMVTAKDDKDSENKAREMGASDYVTKPINFEKLIQIVQKYTN